MSLDLKDFCFEIAERQVAVNDDINSKADWQDDKSYLDNSYKAIVREDTNTVISIVRGSYKIVTNRDLINELLHFLAVSGEQFKIDPSHSFVQDNRMRLMITFPNLKLQDKESDINLSLFIHNSYDLSEGIRFYFGAIRSVCSNGMVFGEILGRYYSKHTSGFQMSDFAAKLDEAKNYFPAIQERIDQLQMLPATPKLVEQISDKISKRLADDVLAQHDINQMSQWELLNKTTYYVSHDVDKPHRARHQQSVSRIFGL